MSKTRRERTERKLRDTITHLKDQIATRDASTQKPVLQRKIDGLKSTNDELKTTNDELKTKIDEMKTT